MKAQADSGGREKYPCQTPPGAGAGQACPDFTALAMPVSHAQRTYYLGAANMTKAGPNHDFCHEEASGRGVVLYCSGPCFHPLPALLFLERRISLVALYPLVG